MEHLPLLYGLFFEKPAGEGNRVVHVASLWCR
jgi:hypothetical protein